MTDSGVMLTEEEMKNTQVLLEIDRARNDGEDTVYLDTNYVATLPMDFSDTLRR